MKILIIGKNGFIGSNLWEYFQNCAYNVEAVSHTELDLLDEDKTKQFLKSKFYDVVIDASVYNPRMQENGNPNLEIENNLRMFLNLEKYSHLYGKLFYIGSGAEFDKREDMNQVNEDDFVSRKIPDYPYAFYKYTIQQIIKNSKNIYNLRVFGLYGAYENWRKTFISGACCKAIKGLPITIRKNVYFDYLYVKDFCKIVDILINKDLSHHDYNVVSGRRVALSTIAETVKEISGKEIPIYVCEDGLGIEYSASNHRLINEIGTFEYQDMKESIQELYSWYDERKNMIDIYSLLYQ